MECFAFFAVNKVRGRTITVSRFKRKGGKLTRAVYAGLIVCFVPSILCQDWSRRLTFDEIYNDTDYVQLHQRPRPYRITEYSYDITHLHPLGDERNSHSHNVNYEGDRHRFNVEDKRIATSHGHNVHNVRIADNVNVGNTEITLEDHEFNVDDARISNHGYNIGDYKSADSNRYHDKGTQITNNQEHNLGNYGRFVESHRYNPEDNRILYNQRPTTDQKIIGPGPNSEDHYKGNGVELGSDVIVADIVKEPLLVGFSHDPFRYSVPEEDYLKGVRDMTPKSIMSKGENRGKRGVLHLYNMMYCATGCEPLAYKGYGCYCGFLGSGKPTDGIDRCCKIHDECYENIYCPFFTVYFQPYYWKCYRGRPLCALENYHTQHQFINGCAARLCDCDRRFAMCVKRYACPRSRALCRSSPLRLLQNLLMF